MTQELIYDDGDETNTMEVQAERKDSYLVGWLDEKNGEWREEEIQKSWVADEKMPYELA